MNVSPVTAVTEDTQSGSGKSKSIPTGNFNLLLLQLLGNTEPVPENGPDLLQGKNPGSAEPDAKEEKLLSHPDKTEKKERKNFNHSEAALPAVPASSPAADSNEVKAAASAEKQAILSASLGQTPETLPVSAPAPEEFRPVLSNAGGTSAPKTDPFLPVDSKKPSAPTPAGKTTASLEKPAERSGASDSFRKVSPENTDEKENLFVKTAEKPDSAKPGQNFSAVFTKSADAAVNTELSSGQSDIFAGGKVSVRSDNREAPAEGKLAVSYKWDSDAAGKTPRQAEVPDSQNGWAAAGTEMKKTAEMPADVLQADASKAEIPPDDSVKSVLFGELFEKDFIVKQTAAESAGTAVDSSSPASFGSPSSPAKSAGAAVDSEIAAINSRSSGADGIHFTPESEQKSFEKTDTVRPVDSIPLKHASAAKSGEAKKAVVTAPYANRPAAKERNAEQDSDHDGNPETAAKTAEKPKKAESGFVTASSNESGAKGAANIQANNFRTDFSGPGKAEVSVRREIVSGTSDAVKKALKSGRSELRLHLVPEDLGAVTIRMISQDGKLSLRITADNDSTGKMLASGMQDLSNSLKQQGVPVEKAEVLSTGYGSADPGTFSGGGNGEEQQPFPRLRLKPERRTSENAVSFADSGLSVLA